MAEPTETRTAKLGNLAKSALDTGASAINAATSGAKTGAKLAVGSFFAGCNLLLDLGVKAARHLPLEGTAGELTDSAADEHRRFTGPPPMGWWIPDGTPPDESAGSLVAALGQVSRPIHVVAARGRMAVGLGGRSLLGDGTINIEPSYPLHAFAPVLSPQQLGDPAFRSAHRLKYAYVAGAMANGIGSEEIVEAMGRAGMLAFFGAAGLSLDRVEKAIDRIQKNLGDAPYGFNLIHSPNEPGLETGVVDLYLRRGIRLVDASAYLDLTLPLVRYRVKGIRRDPDGRVACPQTVVAKVSRAEVARKFMSPPPETFLKALVDAREITPDQARWAESIPMATDITVEADSGGHTDNRPAISLIPSMIALRDELQAKYEYAEPLRVGAAGGISTPASAAAAFAMGAAYILTGSVNQACVEAGTSQAVREMLAQAGPADVAMAPAADMFEMGVKVQVLKWGTMFAVRARKLYDLYRAHGALEEIPPRDRAVLEKDYFRCTLEEAWSQTRSFFEVRDPAQIARAEKDAKHKMALVFRSYLGRSSDWANKGEPSRKADYQIWCGPAMGAFNEWVRGSFLEKPDNRTVVTVAMNLMLGAAVLTRANWLKTQGLQLPAAAQHYRPLEMDAISTLLQA
ncbi:MAG TPA: PfaD family polyunsaturated fatty acid/polyketide biosynthesis protein [Phycisphaerae bacterium]|nr:PfaD family polyunsaturated fatty acid/polyketide biosynthesis protein [Phycisphaerae bacterium]